MPELSVWTDFLDRVEERLRLLERAALGSPGAAHSDAGPELGTDDIPTIAPTEAERVRLAMLLHAHEQAAERISTRRAALQRAQHYHVSGAAR